MLGLFVRGFISSLIPRVLRPWVLCFGLFFIAYNKIMTFPLNTFLTLQRVFLSFFGERFMLES